MLPTCEGNKLMLRKMVGGSLSGRLRGGAVEDNIATKYYDQDADIEMDFPPWSMHKAHDPDVLCMADDFRDFKDSGFESPREGEDLSPGRSRIPVAVRRLRDKAGDKIAAGEDGSRSCTDQASQDDNWQNYNCGSPDDRYALCKPGETRRLHRASSKLGSLVPKLDAAELEPLKVGPRVCPHCNRTFAVVSKEGVYVAFSIGRNPLIALLILIVLLALAPFVYPYISSWCSRRFKGFIPPEPPKPKKGWLYNF